MASSIEESGALAYDNSSNTVRLNGGSITALTLMGNHLNTSHLVSSYWPAHRYLNSRGEGWVVIGVPAKTGGGGGGLVQRDQTHRCTLIHARLSSGCILNGVGHMCKLKSASAQNQSLISLGTVIMRSVEQLKLFLSASHSSWNLESTSIKTIHREHISVKTESIHSLP